LAHAVKQELQLRLHLPKGLSTPFRALQKINTSLIKPQADSRRHAAILHPQITSSQKLGLNLSIEEAEPLEPLDPAQFRTPHHRAVPCLTTYSEVSLTAVAMRMHMTPPRRRS